MATKQQVEAAVQRGAAIIMQPFPNTKVVITSSDANEALMTINQISGTDIDPYIWEHVVGLTAIAMLTNEEENWRYVVSRLHERIGRYLGD